MFEVLPQLQALYHAFSSCRAESRFEVATEHGRVLFFWSVLIAEIRINNGQRSADSTSTECFCSSN